MTGPDDLLIANGVDAITGDYLLAPQSIRDVALAARRPEPDRTPTAPLRTQVEVVTYVTDDPASVAHDEAMGRITGARLYLPSYVDLDGTARHVGPARAPSAPRAIQFSVDPARVFIDIVAIVQGPTIPFGRIAPAVERMKEHT